MLPLLPARCDGSRDCDPTPLPGPMGIDGRLVIDTELFPTVDYISTSNVPAEGHAREDSTDAVRR